MTTRKQKAGATPPSPDDDVRPTGEQSPEEVRAILWKIASDPRQSGTARVSACALLLRNHRERDDGVEAGQDDLSRRAIKLMQRAAAN
jgi:hypothetical protein